MGRLLRFDGLVMWDERVKDFAAICTSDSKERSVYC